MSDQVAGLLDTERIRKDFPILGRTVHQDRPLVYLDSAASSQRPRQVIEAMSSYYEEHHANIHRGIHVLAEEATALYEGARDKVAGFVHALDRSEIVFTKNSTEAINLVATTLAWADEPYRVTAADEVVVTEMEHHSNLLPWQTLCQRTGAKLRWFGLTEDGRLDLSNLDQVITERTKVVAVTHMSNLLGTVNPIDVITRRAHEVGAMVLVDASQSAPHLPVDVTALGVDFVAFTSHKMCGPTGVGVLWGRRSVLEDLPPFMTGGSMVETVGMESSTFAAVPHKFEAGTPPIAEAVGLGAAVDYLTGISMERVREHEHALTRYALDALATVDGLRLIGPPTPEDRGAIFSFTLGDIHPHDVGQVLDEQGVAVRVGHHCARPTCVRFGVPATTRASFYLYNSLADVDALVRGLEHVKRFFGAT